MQGYEAERGKKVNEWTAAEEGNVPGAVKRGCKRPCGPFFAWMRGNMVSMDCSVVLHTLYHGRVIQVVISFFKKISCFLLLLLLLLLP